jgi:hypothetical protein
MMELTKVENIMKRNLWPMVIVLENNHPIPQPEVWGPIKLSFKNGIVAEANAPFPTTSTAFQLAKNNGS